jgi:hypothetical protein
MSFIPTELLTELVMSAKSLVNYSLLPDTLSCQLKRESPTEHSVGIFQIAKELFTF